MDAESIAWPRALLTALRSGRARVPQLRSPLRGSSHARIRSALRALSPQHQLALLDGWEGRIAGVAADLVADPLEPAWRASIESRALPRHAEAALLARVDRDRWGRAHWLLPVAARALARMRCAALADGVDLEVVSSYRSVRDQRRILARKLAQGQSLAEILRVNAPPGCSEHHSGCAVDLAAPGEAVLTADFAESKAFAWLGANAARFGFRMSYPPDNPWGYVHEPWHWCYVGT